jgi:hypothetical protein
MVIQMALDSKENPSLAEAAAADYNELLDPNQFAMASGTRHGNMSFAGMMAEAQTAQVPDDDFDYDADDFETYDELEDDDTLDEDNIDSAVSRGRSSDMGEEGEARGASDAETTLVAEDEGTEGGGSTSATSA